MNPELSEKLSELITYKPTLKEVLKHWDATSVILQENGMSSIAFLQLIEESQTENLDQVSFGDHVLHKLSKINLVYSATQRKRLSIQDQNWFQENLNSSIGDLIQIKDYADKTPNDSRSFIGCISQENNNLPK